MSYRHDRRRKLIRRWEREGWKVVGRVAEADFGNIKFSGGGLAFTAKPGTLPSVAAMEYAARLAPSKQIGDAP